MPTGNGRAGFLVTACAGPDVVEWYGVVQARCLEPVLQIGGQPGVARTSRLLCPPGRLPGSPWAGRQVSSDDSGGSQRQRAGCCLEGRPGWSYTGGRVWAGFREGRFCAERQGVTRRLGWRGRTDREKTVRRQALPRSGRSRGRLRILSSVCRLPGALRVPPHGAVWKQSAALCAVGMRQPLHRAGAGKERARGWRKGGSPQGPCSVPVLFWRATHRKCRRRRKGGVRPGSVWALARRVASAMSPRAKASTQFSASGNRRSMAWRSCGAGRPSSPADGIAALGAADAYPQAGKIGRAQALGDGLQTVVPGIAAAAFEFHTAGRQIEFVVDDQDMLRGDAVPGSEGLHAVAGQVHEGLRLGQQPVARQDS